MAWLVWMVLLVPGLAWAERVVTLGQPLVIRLEPNQPTAVVFPEPLTHLTIGYDKESIGADRKGATLFLQVTVPELAGRFFVVGESGDLYEGSFKTGTPSDSTVIVRRSAPVTSPKTVPLSAASLMRVLQDPAQTLPGQQPGELPTPAFPEGPLQLVQMTSLKAGDWWGMTLHVQNTSPQALALDVRLKRGGPMPDLTLTLDQVAWPPRLQPCLLSAESDILEPGVVTRVHVVLERRPQ